MAKRGVARDRCFGLELDADVVEGCAPRASPPSPIASRTRRRSRRRRWTSSPSFTCSSTWRTRRNACGSSRAGSPPAGCSRSRHRTSTAWIDGWFKQSFWGGYHIPRHWNLFSPEALARLLTDAGLEIVDTRFQTGHSFWMWSVHHRVRYGTPPRPRVARWFNPFKGLPFLAAFTAFDMLRGQLGARTSAMLIVARRPR